MAVTTPGPPNSARIYSCVVGASTSRRFAASNAISQAVIGESKRSPRLAAASIVFAVALEIVPLALHSATCVSSKIGFIQLYEWPPIKRRSNVRPRPESLTLTVTVSKLETGVEYTLYRYDGFASVPDRDFNRHANSASSHWTFTLQSGDSYTMTQTIESDQTVIYRAVPASGP